MNIDESGDNGVLSFRKVGVTLAAYGLLSTIHFGGPVQPLALGLFWPERLGVAWWPANGVVWAVSAASVFLLPRHFGTWKLTLFVSFALVGATLAIGIYADSLRTAAF